MLFACHYLSVCSLIICIVIIDVYKRILQLILVSIFNYITHTKRSNRYLIVLYQKIYIKKKKEIKKCHILQIKLLRDDGFHGNCCPRFVRHARRRAQIVSHASNR